MFNGAHLPPCASMTRLPFLLLREAEAMAPSPLRPGNPGVGVELKASVFAQGDRSDTSSCLKQTITNLSVQLPETKHKQIRGDQISKGTSPVLLYLLT